MNPHQRRASLVLQLIDILLRPILRDLEEQLARQRVAIGMETIGRQTRSVHRRPQCARL